MNQEINKFLVNKDSSIKEAMRVIDRGGLGIAFLVDENKKLFGAVTDGDIRRAILKGINIEKSIQKIANQKPIIVKGNFNQKDFLKIRQEIRKKMPTMTSSFKIPVINDNGKIKDIVLIYPNKEDNFQVSELKSKISREGVKKILLIGGAGYLGSVLCRKLLNQGYRVRVLDNLTYGDEGIKDFHQNKNLEFLEGDIRNISQIVGAIRGVDAVIHLAAIVGDSACARKPKETLEINYLATKAIAESCRYFQVNRFIFASTCSVYGENPLPEQQSTEASSLNPVSLYAETKIKCEQGILEAMDENFSPTILRMATLYGYSPNMRFDLAVNLLTAKALFERKIPIFGGKQWRPWLHLEDAARAYIACLEQPIEKVRGKIFNVLSENYRLIEVGNIIKSIYPEAELEIIDKRVIDRRNYNVSFEKISRTLNYQPKKKIPDGVLEIKNLMEKGLIKNYKDSKYRTS